MEKEIVGGVFMVARRIFGGDLWLKKRATWLKVWIYILGRVSHEPNERLKLDRGEGFFNWTNEKSLLGSDISRDTIQRTVRFCQQNGMIRTSRSTRGVRIKVLNYNTYQRIETYSRTGR